MIQLIKCTKCLSTMVEELPSTSYYGDNNPSERTYIKVTPKSIDELIKIKAVVTESWGLELRASQIGVTDEMKNVILTQNQILGYLVRQVNNSISTFYIKYKSYYYKPEWFTYHGAFITNNELLVINDN